MLISVDAPYVPNNMVVAATGPTVTDLVVSNKGVMFGGKGTDPGQHVYGVSQPTGQFTVSVTTSDQTTPPSLQIVFNVSNLNWGGTPQK